jgi:hypothetical protein
VYVLVWDCAARMKRKLTAQAECRIEYDHISRVYIVVRSGKNRMKGSINRLEAVLALLEAVQVNIEWEDRYANRTTI